MFLSCSLAIIDCFVAYMQQTDEHQGFALWLSLEPTHCIQATFFGCLPSDGLLTSPLYGPDAERIRSNCTDETTFCQRPRPSSCLTRASYRSRPGLRMMEPTLSSI